MRWFEGIGIEKGTVNRRVFLAEDRRRIEDNNGILISMKGYIHRLEENRLSRYLCHVGRVKS